MYHVLNVKFSLLLNHKFFTNKTPRPPPQKKKKYTHTNTKPLAARYTIMRQVGNNSKKTHGFNKYLRECPLNTISNDDM